jgi:hypothetical protein
VYINLENLFRTLQYYIYCTLQLRKIKMKVSFRSQTFLRENGLPNVARKKIAYKYFLIKLNYHFT